MNTIAPAASEEPLLELPSVAFFGRSFNEYCDFFGLDAATLPGRRILDVAAGPSAFTAEANARGADAVAVDPLYGTAPEGLEQHIMLDYRAMFEQVRSRPQLFRLRTFTSVEDAEKSRRSAARRFLVDYGAHFVHDRYVGAVLPRLPFEDASFDLVLCAHFLFIYARQYDFDFHVAACRELVRVSRGEVRIHPIVGAGGMEYPRLADLIAALEADGVSAEVIQVDYEFFRGTDRTLVLRRG